MPHLDLGCAQKTPTSSSSFFCWSIPLSGPQNLVGREIQPGERLGHTSPARGLGVTCSLAGSSRLWDSSVVPSMPRWRSEGGGQNAPRSSFVGSRTNAPADAAASPDVRFRGAVPRVVWTRPFNPHTLTSPSPLICGSPLHAFGFPQWTALQKPSKENSRTGQSVSFESLAILSRVMECDQPSAWAT